MTAPIPFVDLTAQQARIRPRLEARLAGVLAHGRYVMGPEVGELEAALAEFAGVAHCVTLASGTDALRVALMALGVGPGDGVLVPSFTFAASAEPVAGLGAIPVFVNVDDATFNLDPARLGAGLAAARRAGLRPAGIVAVDMFGRPADYAAIHEFAASAGLWVVADAAQSFGATCRARRVGSLARATATSFYPSKPLGCYGDGGAVLTDDDALAAAIRSLREHGRGRERYEHVRIGPNSRLDTLQAAVLLAKLEIFADEIAARQRIVARYGELLGDVVAVPSPPSGATSVWAQYTIRTTGRDRLAERLRAAGVPTAVHYPTPLHRQPAYARFPVADGGCAVAERLAGEVLSLPMHAYLDPTTQERIAAEIRRHTKMFAGRSGGRDWD